MKLIGGNLKIFVGVMLILASLAACGPKEPTLEPDNPGEVKVSSIKLYDTEVALGKFVLLDVDIEHIIKIKIIIFKIIIIDIELILNCITV